MKKFLINQLVNRPIIRWALVGLFTTLIDYFIFLSIYKYQSSVLISNLASGSISIFFNYLAHYFWSFKSQEQHLNSSIKYFFNLFTFWILNTLFVKIFISQEIQPWVAKLLPIPIIAPLSFLSLNFFVFKKNKLSIRCINKLKK